MMLTRLKPAPGATTLPMGAHMRSAGPVLFSVGACATLILGCQPVVDPATELGWELQAIVDSVVAESGSVPAAALYVTAPALGLDWQGAAGIADPATGEPMTPDHPVLVASNTKTFIAASILRLWENGRLGLDDPIADHLPHEYSQLLSSDGYRPEAISIRHLLTHTSGLYDYADREIYPAKILADPTHRWTRTEQLEAAVAWGDPVGDPGDVYNYSDTGYILLGSILEQVTGQSMPEAVRELVDYERIGLDSTWFATLEPRPSSVPELAHQFYGTVDATTIDPSTDLYGGGGIAATVGDLGRFMRALFTGGVYSSPETARVMLTTVESVRVSAEGQASGLAPGTYRMGVWVMEVEGLTVYRHSGFWGTVADYVPELDLTIAATVNQNQDKAALREMVRRTVAVVRDADGAQEIKVETSNTDLHPMEMASVEDKFQRTTLLGCPGRAQYDVGRHRPTEKIPFAPPLRSLRLCGSKRSPPPPTASLPASLLFNTMNPCMPCSTDT